MLENSLPMSDDSESESEFVDALVKSAENELLPDKSKYKYKKAYNEFVKWKAVNKINAFSEKVLLAYFYERSEKLKPTSLWAYYSMVKSVMKLENNIDISSYHKLTAFLSKKSRGYQPVQAKALLVEEINKFVSIAPDNEWLDVKTVCIFGICGGLRTDEMPRITVNDIEKHGSIFLVTVLETKTKVSRQFTITGTFCDVVQRYSALRCSHTVNPRFFVNYKDGKCTNQPIGKNKFSNMPRRIASYLKLPQQERYTGHSFRRSGTTILAEAGASSERVKRFGAWRSSKVAEGYVAQSLKYKIKTGDLIASTITSSTIHASQGYIDNVKDDSDNESSTMHASQGYRDNVKDDLDNSFEEIVDFSGDQDTLQRSLGGSKEGVTNTLHVGQVKSEHTMKPLADDQSEGVRNPLRAMNPLRINEIENKLTRSDVGQVKSEDQSERFHFHNCSITFHMK